MGWFGRLRGKSTPPENASHPNAPLRKFSATTVSDVISLLSNSDARISRAEALSVPAVVRGRNLICSIATLPLQLVRVADNQVIDNPLLRQLDRDVANVVHLAQTIEDLIFEGIAWWRITSTDFGGFPASVRRIDPGSVSVTPPSGRTPAPLPSGYDPRDALVYVEGRPVPASQVIRFDSPNPAILTVGARVIRRAILLDKAAKMYADDPRPLDYFIEKPDATPLDDEEITNFLSTWVARRKQRATGYINKAVEYQTVDGPSPQQLQLVELQNQASLDIGNLFGVDPEELGQNVSPRTYFNAQDRRMTRINDVLAPYMRAITDTLNIPSSVFPRSYSARFDLRDYLKADPATRWSVYQTAHDLGVLSDEEIRAMEGLPPGAPPDPPRPGIGGQDESQPAEESTVDANQPPGYTFDASAEAKYPQPSTRTFVDIPLEKFTVDRETRTIEGVAVPYGRSAKGVRFEKGSLMYGDASRVKLLVDHDPTQAVGVATTLKDGSNGFVAKFKVARTAEGDRALTLAEDGVLDGLSVGVDFDLSKDTTPDPRHKTGILVRRADLREVSLTSMPAFDDARVTRVAASLTEGTTVTDTDTTPAPATPEPTPAQVPVQLNLSTTTATTANTAPVQPEVRQFVDPRRPVSTMVSESLPYRFDRAGNFTHAQYEFSTDLIEAMKRGDVRGTGTEAGKRAMGMIRAMFADDVTISTDINELNPAIQRPDMYVDLRAFRYPIWDAINKGAPPNGIQPFTFPKRSASTTIAVADHVEGTEPASEKMVSTSDTVTPTPISGKASITREVWDQGGNPAISNLIRREFTRSWFEGLENAAAAFLVTLTAADDIALDDSSDELFVADWKDAVADLQFERGYDFDTYVATKELFKQYSKAVDGDKRPIYPIISPVNANGQATSRFQSVNAEGYVVLPAWALNGAAVTGGGYLFDSTCVWGWATAPQELQFPGTSATPSYAPVAFIDLAVWGYKAFVCTDIGGVREVTLE